MMMTFTPALTERETTPSYMLTAEAEYEPWDFSISDQLRLTRDHFAPTSLIAATV